MLVVLLLGTLILREPRFAQLEDVFLRWLLAHSQGSSGPPVPLTVVDISRDALTDANSRPEAVQRAPAEGSTAGAASPLEFALFLQSVLDFQPSVIAFENILRWNERDMDQEQVFLDQAMRVPKLLLASELSTTADLDAPWSDIRAFNQVTGRRGDLAAFAGITRQPNEDLRLISTPGFINLPNEISSEIRIPLLFLCRGEVIPSFTLQAIMLWLRVTPAEVKIEIGSHILLPQNRRIPINRDGTLLVDPNASTRARHVTLNELLLAAQQRDTGGTAPPQFAQIRDGLVLVRMPDNPLSPPDLFAATIASIQANRYLRRISPIFDCVILLLVSGLFATVREVARVDLVLCGFAFTAAYCLFALGMLSRTNVWLPGVLPLGAVWLSIFLTLFQRKDARREATVATPASID